MAKIKVFNRNGYDYGIILSDGVRQHNVKAGSFAIIDEDEIYYLHSISKAFTDKHLTVDENNPKYKEIMENMGFVDNTFKVFTKPEIETLLKGNATTMKRELEKVTEPHLRYQVFEVAKTLDLPASKIKFVEEYTGLKLLDEEI